jgi:hypothetical protein
MVVLLLALGAGVAAGAALRQTAGVDLTGDTDGDARVADADAAGCVAANASRPGSEGAAAAGLCRSASSTPARGGDQAPAGGKDGGAGPGDSASGGSSPGGILAAASGNLPFTGLPLRAVALTGLGLIGLGVLVRRRRPDLAAT